MTATCERDVKQVKKQTLFSFPKKDRLLKRQDFLRVSRCGKKVSNKHFIVIFSPAQTGKTRLVITVSKKVGCAAVRNRIKRFARECFRLNRHEIKGNWDISIIAKNASAGVASEQVFLSLSDIFKQISGKINH